MNKQFIYRVVEIKGNDVAWCSQVFCLSKEAVKIMANDRAKCKKVFGYTVEEYKGHKWDSVALKEASFENNWISVEKIWKVTDKQGFSSVIGFVTYAAV